MAKKIKKAKANASPSVLKAKLKSYERQEKLAKEKADLRKKLDKYEK